MQVPRIYTNVRYRFSCVKVCTLSSSHTSTPTIRPRSSSAEPSLPPLLNMRVMIPMHPRNQISHFSRRLSTSQGPPRYLRVIRSLKRRKDSTLRSSEALTTFWLIYGSWSGRIPRNTSPKSSGKWTESLLRNLVQSRLANLNASDKWRWRGSPKGYWQTR